MPKTVPIGANKQFKAAITKQKVYFVCCFKYLPAKKFPTAKVKPIMIKIDAMPTNINPNSGGGGFFPSFKLPVNIAIPIKRWIKGKRAKIREIPA